MELIRGYKDDPHWMTCAECGHWYPYEPGAIGGDGTCRVIGPQIIAGQGAGWPPIEAADRGCSLHTGRTAHFYEDESED